jgi:aminopeptidase N
MEYPGVTLLSDRIYTPDQKWRLDITAAHEVAHQWWYGVVGNDILNEPWLDEALATFSSGVYVEDVDGEAAFRAQYEQWVERYETGQRNGTVGRINWPVMRFRNSWDYVTTVYYEGAIFLERLRGEIGDTALFGALQQYYQTFGYRQAASEDFLGAIEQASGRHLDDFYARWLYKN